jgi:hypothetical protein
VKHLWRESFCATKFVAAWVTICAWTATAQTNFYTLTSTGSPSNRVNIVFLAEGYRTNDYAQFLVDATNAANILLTNQPYAEYRSYFNVYAITVPSVQSGSDHPANSISNNTYFNSTFDTANDFYLSFPTDQTGQGKIDALLNTYAPQADLAILLVNDNNPGGSDGGGRTALVARGALFVYPQYIGVLAHETGHVVAGLGDEYTTANPGYPDIEEPNTTRETNRAAIKWTAWISTNTPVPTPSSGNEGVVGLFEGAHYHTTGWYRPKVNCQMGVFAYGLGFCEVCQEAFVLSFYRQIRPIDAFTPVSTNLSVTITQALSFALTNLQPASHALNVQWFTNGLAVPLQTNSTFSLLPATLGNGTHTVAGRVIDPTALVRTDPTNLLRQTLTWNVTVSLPQLQLGAPRWLGTKGFAFQVTGVAPAGFSIHASSNLSSWTAITTNNLTGGQFTYTNQSATNFPLRFYRAVTPPSP